MYAQLHHYKFQIIKNLTKSIVIKFYNSNALLNKNDKELCSKTAEKFSLTIKVSLNYFTDFFKIIFHSEVSKTSRSDRAPE